MSDRPAQPFPAGRHSATVRADRPIQAVTLHVAEEDDGLWFPRLAWLHASGVFSALSPTARSLLDALEWMRWEQRRRTGRRDGRVAAGVAELATHLNVSARSVYRALAELADPPPGVAALIAGDDKRLLAALGPALWEPLPGRRLASRDPRGDQTPARTPAAAPGTDARADGASGPSRPTSAGRIGRATGGETLPPVAQPAPALSRALPPVARIPRIRDTGGETLPPVAQTLKERGRVREFENENRNVVDDDASRRGGEQEPTSEQAEAIALLVRGIPPHLPGFDEARARRLVLADGYTPEQVRVAVRNAVAKRSAPKPEDRLRDFTGYVIVQLQRGCSLFAGSQRVDDEAARNQQAIAGAIADLGIEQGPELAAVNRWWMGLEPAKRARFLGPQDRQRPAEWIWAAALRRVMAAAGLVDRPPPPPTRMADDIAVATRGGRITGVPILGEPDEEFWEMEAAQVHLRQQEQLWEHVNGTDGEEHTAG